MIHCRSHLINWLIKAAKDDILLLNALNDSGTRVEMLGSFDPLPGSKKPGWLIRLTTRFDREELVAIVKDYLGRPDHIFFAPGVDWSAWQGPSDNVLIGGDNNGPDKENSNTSKFHRIERSARVYSQKNRGAGDNAASGPVGKKRGNPPNVSPSTPPVIT